MIWYYGDDDCTQFNIYFIRILHAISAYVGLWLQKLNSL